VIRTPSGRAITRLSAVRDRHSLDQVRAHLGQEQFDRAYATGIALSPDQALDLASGKTLPD
jgi:hypothetical protein